MGRGGGSKAGGCLVVVANLGVYWLGFVALLIVGAVYWSDYAAMRDRYVKTTCRVIETKVIERKEKNTIRYGPAYKVEYETRGSGRRLGTVDAPPGAAGGRQLLTQRRGRRLDTKTRWICNEEPVNFLQNTISDRTRCLHSYGLHPHSC